MARKGYGTRFQLPFMKAYGGKGLKAAAQTVSGIELKAMDMYGPMSTWSGTSNNTGATATNLTGIWAPPNPAFTSANNGPGYNNGGVAVAGVPLNVVYAAGPPAVITSSGGNSWQCDSKPSIMLLNGLQEASTSYGRIGRLMNMKSLQLTITFQLNSLLMSGGGGGIGNISLEQPVRVRMTLVYDRQPNAQFPVVGSTLNGIQINVNPAAGAANPNITTNGYISNGFTLLPAGNQAGAYGGLYPAVCTQAGDGSKTQVFDNSPWFLPQLFQGRDYAGRLLFSVWGPPNVEYQDRFIILRDCKVYFPTNGAKASATIGAGIVNLANNLNNFMLTNTTIEGSVCSFYVKLGGLLTKYQGSSIPPQINDITEGALLMVMQSDTMCCNNLYGAAGAAVNGATNPYQMNVEYCRLRYFDQ